MIPQQKVKQCGGYVYYHYQLPTGDRLTITSPFINEDNIPINFTRKVKEFSYHHYGYPAMYEGQFILNISPEIASIRYKVQEHKY